MTDPRRVAVLTTGRQDWGVLRSTVLALHADPRFDLRLWVGGMHLSRAHGYTIQQIRGEGIAASRHLDFMADELDAATQAGAATALAAAAIADDDPDALLLLGDRFETLAVATAATIARVPIAHLHGGEETEGAIDNAMRHAITKLAHLHLVSHELHAARVLQMGEADDAVIVVGAPGLDNLHRADLPDRDELERSLGIPLRPPVVLVTMHPETLSRTPAEGARAVASAMARVPATYVITQPNSDPGGEAIRQLWNEWTAGRSRVVLVDSLGERRYWGLLCIADAVLGNSSSGIIEAPSAGLPVVDVGDRQKGRLRTTHVETARANTDEVELALRRALSPERRASSQETPPPYRAGPAAPRIVESLARWRPDLPPRKHFIARPAPTA